MNRPWILDEILSEDDSDQELDLATILQYLISELSLTSLDGDTLNSMSIMNHEDELVTYKYVQQPNTEMLDRSEISLLTKQSSGLISKTGEKRPNSVAALICARERGLNGSTAFSKADRCKITNNFLPNKSSIAFRMPTKIFCGTYLNNGKIFLSASQDRVIRCFKITNQYTALVRTILARDVGWSILDVAISPDEKYIAYSSWCNSLHLCKIWEDIENQDVLPLCLEEKKFGIFSLRFRSSGKEILCGANGGDIYVYDLECNKKTLSIHGHSDDVNAVSFADNASQILFSGGDDGFCKVWDRRMLSESNPQQAGYFAGHMHGITYIEPRGDGMHLITNSKDQSIKLWDIRKLSSNIGVENTQKAVFLQTWDYRGKIIPKSFKNPNKRLEGDTSIMTYRGHSVSQTLFRCHFSPAESTGQRYIYTGCATGQVVVYDVLTGRIEKQLKGHKDCVRDVSWHPHRPEIISVSWDGKIVRWTYDERQLSDSGKEDGVKIPRIVKRKLNEPAKVKE